MMPSAPSAPAKNGHSTSAVDEVTPLLLAAESGPTAQPNEQPLLHKGPPNPAADEDDDTPLPNAQIWLLCYARAVEPMAFFCIFPFISQMIWETGDIAEADIGFYSGLIESLFSVTQMLLVGVWGRASDIMGRKPVLVTSLAGMSISMAAFGMSKKIWQLILIRCIAGAFAGTLVTLRAMISENSTKKTQAVAFSRFAFFGNIGIMAGPLIGGALCEPAKQYPGVFGNIQFFKDYPYALPTVVTGIFSASATITSALFVEETINKKDNEGSGEPTSMSMLELLRHEGVGTVLFIYTYIMFIGLGYTALMPIFYFTSPKLGGYGFSPREISIFFAGTGLSQAIWTLLLLPPLQRRYNTGGVLRGCAIGWPISSAFSILGVELLRQNWRLAFWIIIPVSQVIFSGLSIGYTAVQLALNDIAPSHKTLGTLNALAITFVSGIRAIAPGLFSSIYATGVRYQILGGHFAWFALMLFSMALIISLRWLPEKAEGRISKRNEQDQP